MSDARRLLADIERKLIDAEEASRPIPEASPPVRHRRLCVGMATFDDFDGVWFTIEALLLYHPEVADDLTFLILDNHPEASMAADLKSLDQKVPALRYIPFRGYRSTAARDLIFREADADVVCCVDSHVLLRGGALSAVLDYFDRHPTSRDLLQGPLMTEDLARVGTHFEPVWGHGMYGKWATDPQIEHAVAPFEIPMQGLGFFACRKDAWPGLNPRFRGFGGEEGYLHEKIRQRGGRVLCHPALGWVHRFTRTSGPPYRPNWEDRVRNYRVGWAEIGWDTSPMEEHFRAYLGSLPEADAEKILAQTARQAASPFTYFDAVFLLEADRESERHREALRHLLDLDVLWRTEIWPVSGSPDHGGDIDGWRALLREAEKRDYQHVLGFEGDVPLTGPDGAPFDETIAELAEAEWDVCLLNPAAPGAASSGGHQAIAIHRGAFSRIVAGLPEDASGLDAFVDRHGSFEGYLRRLAQDGALRMISPARTHTVPA